MYLNSIYSREICIYLIGKFWCCALLQFTCAFFQSLAYGILLTMKNSFIYFSVVWKLLFHEKCIEGFAQVDRKQRRCSMSSHCKIEAVGYLILYRRCNRFSCRNLSTQVVCHWLLETLFTALISPLSSSGTYMLLKLLTNVVVQGLHSLKFLNYKLGTVSHAS